MVEELLELISDMQAICNCAERTEVVEIAKHAADLLDSVNETMPDTIHKRRCHECGWVAYHADRVAPYVCCDRCGSRDTRQARARVDAPAG